MIDSRWIFGFGSLMWEPGFDFIRAIPHATLHGYRRDFTVRSTSRWGTKANPAPTLGLEKGGVTIGMAFEVEAKNYDKVMKYLHKREGKDFEFPEKDIQLIINNKPTIVKATVCINKQNHSYLGKLGTEQRASMVLKAKGKKGTSKDYLLETREMLIMLIQWF